MRWTRAPPGHGRPRPSIPPLARLPKPTTRNHSDPALPFRAERHGPRRFRFSWPTRLDARALRAGEIRKQLVKSRAVDGMTPSAQTCSYTVTLPCTGQWFLDRGKPGTKRADTVLFIDARHVYRQVDTVHRDWTPAQIGFLANIVRLYRGEALDLTCGGDEAEAKLQEVFGKTPVYVDVPGLCKAVSLEEIEVQAWSLHPGRYVGMAAGADVSDRQFREHLLLLSKNLEALNIQAHELEETIARNVAGILEE
ncbi:MAG: N-6 DNA methylase [Planctomycetota bacterium]